MTHTFYSDPGHGWLAVPRQELIDLGILQRISSYSYQRGTTVYLEEDCDMSVYAQAIKATGRPFEYRSARQANNHSRIRGYRCFAATTDEFVQSLENWNKRVHEKYREQIATLQGALEQARDELEIWAMSATDDEDTTAALEAANEALQEAENANI